MASWGAVEPAPVGWLDVGPGLAAARVSRDRRHHWVTARRDPLPGHVRDRAVAAVAADPVLREEVLLGRAPAALAAVFRRERAELFPADPAGIDLSCSCPVRGCPHGMQVVAAMARAFDADPYLLLAWCGLERWELLRGLSGAGPQVRVGPPSASAFWERAAPLPPCPVWAGDPGGLRPPGAATDAWADAQAYLRGLTGTAFRDGRKPSTGGESLLGGAGRGTGRGDEPT
ncbi:hypothetical protein [Nocardiopsis dassonvillei]|uniref:hypothetical protein n=1 Tax=Nocardiopsis dassonvillei TaxID=2014 RepID=UPI003F564052